MVYPFVGVGVPRLGLEVSGRGFLPDDVPQVRHAVGVLIDQVTSRLGDSNVRLHDPWLCTFRDPFRAWRFEVDLRGPWFFRVGLFPLSKMAQRCSTCGVQRKPPVFLQDAKAKPTFCLEGTILRLV